MDKKVVPFINTVCNPSQSKTSEAQEEGGLHSQCVLPTVRAAVQQVHGGSGHGSPAEEGLQLQKEVKEVVASTTLLHGGHQRGEQLHPAPRYTPRVQIHNQGIHLRACYRTDVFAYIPSSRAIHSL